MTTEIVIAHKSQHDIWSTLTFIQDVATVQVYHGADGSVGIMSRASAELTIQYAQQSGDYIVEEIRDYLAEKGN